MKASPGLPPYPPSPRPPLAPAGSPLRHPGRTGGHDTTPPSCPRPAGAARLRTALTIASTAGILLPGKLAAEGFRNPPPGAFNLGRAGGRIAQVDDASAVAQNPANLRDLTSLQVALAPGIVYTKTEFESATASQQAKTRDPWKFLPNLFIGSPLHDTRFSLGLGVTTPYGLANEWDRGQSAFAPGTGLFTYSAPYFAELTSINFNASVAAQLTPQLSVGAGFNAMWSELHLKQLYRWSYFPFPPPFNAAYAGDPDSPLRLKGDGFGYGANVGVTWQIAERHRLAATYRSPITVDYDGRFESDFFPSRAPGLGLTPNSDFSSRIQFPTIVAFGYGFQPTDSLRLEADFEWLQFSNFDSLDLELGPNALLFGVVDTLRVPQKWDNTFTAGLSADWEFRPGWWVRGGYQFYESPVPDATFSPTIPDANQHVLTLGLGYRAAHHLVEIGYGLDFYKDRTIENNEVQPAFNGRYQTTVHLFAFQYAYSF